ncbi:MAG: hypothetical protein ACFFC6_05635 [Promethearchaeota archaeon]
MRKLKSCVKYPFNVFLTCFLAILFFTMSLQATGRSLSVIWQDNFDDGTLDDWIITGRHYVVSTDTYTKWNGSASATSGKLAFVTENHWENWADNRIMNITWCWYQSAVTFGQWSFDIFPAEDNFIAINFADHFSDPNSIVEDDNCANATFVYAIFILTAPYEPEHPSAAYVSNDFTSPSGVTKKDFTGEPCFIFIKMGKDIAYTVFAIEEFPADILTLDVLTVHITRDNSSKFTCFVNENDKAFFSVTDTSPPPTSLNAEGYYFGIFSFGGGSWIDNITVSDTITVTEEKTTSEPGIVPLLVGFGILIIIRSKRGN